LTPESTVRFGHLVAPGVVAPHHQHFFNLRLDFDCLIDNTPGPCCRTIMRDIQALLDQRSEADMLSRPRFGRQKLS
jgi:hypothetical protein